MRISDKTAVLGHPLLRPTKSWPEHGKRELELLDRALGNQGGLGGLEIAAFEQAFAELVHRLVTPDGQHDGTHVVATTNGTQAIQLALEALGIGGFRRRKRTRSVTRPKATARSGSGRKRKRGRVLVPGMTWQATAGAVLDVNAIPVLIDVLEDGTMDPDLVEAELERTKDTDEFPEAVIVVHLYDRAAQIVRLTEICMRFGVPLIEDCAHAVGAMVDGRPLGTFGVIGTFSLQGSKGFTTGEGGMMITRVAHLARRLRSLISCGRSVDPIAESPIAGDTVSEFWRTMVAERGLAPYGDQSGNYRMNNITAGLGNAQAERFAGWYSAREKTLAELTTLLPTVPGIGYRVQPEVTHPVAYMLAFSYDREQYAGMDIETFIEVLHHLLGSGETQLVLRAYDPLGGGPKGYHSPVYNPLTKSRHWLDDEYANAIDPSAANLPMTHAFFAKTITIQHSFLREDGAAAILVKALLWMHANAAAIVAAATPANA